MVHISAIFPEKFLNEEIANGYVRAQRSPDGTLIIYNYSEKAQFERRWSDVTLNCRGLITDICNNIVARPFKKFFNFGERPLEFSTHDPVEVTDKKDGSLGILYRHPNTGDYAIATRGSFISDQAIHGTEIWRERYSHIAQPLKGYTFLFEIVYPKNRIVLDYGDLDDLILLGAVQNDRGFYFGPTEAAGMLNWPGPVTEVFEYTTLNDCFKVHRPNAEGLVIRSGNRMVKLKQADYVALHKLVTGLNERAVWERLKAGETCASICESLPDEFHGFVKDVSSDLESRFDAIYQSSWEDYVKIKNQLPVDATRKQFAMLAVKTSQPGIMFNHLDGKPVGDIIWDQIKPRGD